MVAEPPGGRHRSDVGGGVRVSGADNNHWRTLVVDCRGDELVCCGRERDCVGAHFV